MTKREFLLQLNDALGAMNEDERSAAVKYYSDYIDDAGEDMEKVLRQLGTPQQVAASILAEAGVEPNANAAAGPYQEEKQRPACGRAFMCRAGPLPYGGRTCRRRGCAGHGPLLFGRRAFGRGTVRVFVFQGVAGCNGLAAPAVEKTVW